MIAPASGIVARRPRLRLDYVVMGGAVAALIVLIVLPLASLVIGSVTVEGELSLDNFARIAERRLYYQALINSLVLGAWTGLFSLLVGLPLAWTVTRTNTPGKGFLRLTASLAYLTPPFLTAIAYYAVWPHKTVFENVAFGLQIRRLMSEEVRKRVAQILDLVGLSGFDARLPSALSGGQQQRVALARSLVVEPRILLLDEPLSNLDAKLRERMRAELKQIQRRTGITFVYVTHDQAEALALSDDIAVMDRGTLQQFGPPREIYQRPANRAVADFMGQVNFLPARIVPAAGGEDLVKIDGGPNLALPLPAELALGDAVDIAVRPENLRLEPVAGARPGTLTGRVVEFTFLGNLTEYVVAIGRDARLRAQAHPSLVLAEGEVVAIGIDPVHCTVFKRASD